MDFKVQAILKMSDGTSKIRTWSFKGLFDAQSKALNFFSHLKARLKPETLESEAFRLWVLADGKCIESFESKRWIEQGEV